jgi:hypothetical protein
MKHPDWFPAPGPEYFKAWMRKITEHSDGLVCISESVACELREWIEENPLKRRDGAPTIDLIDGESICDLLKSLRLGVKVQQIEEVTIDGSWFSSI